LDHAEWIRAAIVEDEHARSVEASRPRPGSGAPGRGRLACRRALGDLGKTACHAHCRAGVCVSPPSGLCQTCQEHRLESVRMPGPPRRLRGHARGRRMPVTTPRRTQSHGIPHGAGRRRLWEQARMDLPGHLGGAGGLSVGAARCRLGALWHVRQERVCQPWGRRRQGRSRGRSRRSGRSRSTSRSSSSSSSSRFVDEQTRRREALGC